MAKSLLWSYLGRISYSLYFCVNLKFKSVGEHEIFQQIWQIHVINRCCKSRSYMRFFVSCYFCCNAIFNIHTNPYWKCLNNFSNWNVLTWSCHFSMDRGATPCNSHDSDRNQVVTDNIVKNLNIKMFQTIYIA